MDFPRQRFRVLRFIGQGGFGQVVEAIDLVRGMRVAVKGVIATDNAVVARFKREFRILYSSNNTHIVPVFDHGIEDLGSERKFCWYSMQLCLDNLASRLEKMSLSQRVDALFDVIDGLLYLWASKLAHRDIKPQNVFVDPDGTCKLGDLGLARGISLADPHSTQLTGGGVIMGTPYYMSPERWMAKSHDPRRSDQYALGVLTFYVLSGGHYPFPWTSHHSVVDVAAMHREMSPTPLKIGEEYCDAVNEVIGRMLSKDPAHRYNRGDRLIRDFRAALAIDRIGRRT